MSIRTRIKGKRSGTMFCALGILLFVFSSNLSALTMDDITSWWKLDEKSGEIATDSKGSNNGTLMNMDAKSCWVDGKNGKALKFDGSNNYVRLTEDLTLSLAGSTLSCWIKLDDKEDNCLFGNSGTSSYKYIRRTKDGRIAIECDNNNKYLLTAQHQLEDNDWHHLVVVFEGKKSKIWLDGKILPISKNTMNADLTLNLIGVRKKLDYLNGMIDEIVVYKRALTKNEISKLK